MRHPDQEGEDHHLQHLHQHQVVLHDHLEFIPWVTTCNRDVNQNNYNAFNILKNTHYLKELMRSLYLMLSNKTKLRDATNQSVTLDHFLYI